MCPQCSGLTNHPLGLWTEAEFCIQAKSRFCLVVLARSNVPPTKIQADCILRLRMSDHCLLRKIINSSQSVAQHRSKLPSSKNLDTHKQTCNSQMALTRERAINLKNTCNQGHCLPSYIEEKSQAIFSIVVLLKPGNVGNERLFSTQKVIRANLYSNSKCS